METFLPASSHVAEARYEVSMQQLEIDFVDGSSYVYSGVPVQVWLSFQHAPSAGAFVARNIRWRYPYEQG